jgi:hypothetical protein
MAKKKLTTKLLNQVNSEGVPLWKQKFPNAKYNPDPKCTKCGGQGYIHTPARYYGDIIIKEGDSPCICIFVSHDIKDLVTESLAKVTREMAKEIGVPGSEDTIGNLFLAAVKSFHDDE